MSYFFAHIFIMFILIYFYGYVNMFNFKAN